MFRYLVGEGRRIKFKASLSYMKSYLKKTKKKRVHSRTSKVFPGMDVSLNSKCHDCTKTLLSSANC